MATKTKNSKKLKNLEKINVDKVTKEITDKKDLKYQYPEDATTLEDRKKFRTTVRRKLASFEKKIEDLMEAGDKNSKRLAQETREEMEEYKSEVLAEYVEEEE